MFQLWLTFANFKNTWTIPENLSREAKNLEKKKFRYSLVRKWEETRPQ